MERSLPYAGGMDVSTPTDPAALVRLRSFARGLWELLTDETSGGGLLHDTEGSVYVEYVAVLFYVSIGTAGATLSLAGPLYSLYKFSQSALIVPFP